MQSSTGFFLVLIQVDGLLQEQKNSIFYLPILFDNHLLLFLVKIASRNDVDTIVLFGIVLICSSMVVRLNTGYCKSALIVYWSNMQNIKDSHNCSKEKHLRLPHIRCILVYFPLLYQKACYGVLDVSIKIF